MPKEYVDSIGNHIERQRGKGPSSTFVPKVPDIAVDEDENAFEAASEKKTKTNDNRHDDTGLGALLCRHDNPIFLVNVDSPGEHQKYAVSMITKLFEYLPESATVGVLYDVGCVLDRSNGLVSLIATFYHLLKPDVQMQYNIFSRSISKRLVFGTSAMHAYGHQWSCQLVYNPRLRDGFGLTDGEGVERLWSRMRRLIGVCRNSAVGSTSICACRSVIDCIVSSVNAAFGSWILRQDISTTASSLTLVAGYLGSYGWGLRRRVQRHERSWSDVVYRWKCYEGSGNCREWHRCLFERVSIQVSNLSLHDTTC